VRPLGPGEAGHHGAQVQLVHLGEVGVLLGVGKISTKK